MKVFRLALMALAVLNTAALGSPQEGRWQRPFPQWSKDEAEKMLEESPWARKQEVRIRYESAARRVAGGTVPSATEGGLTNTTSSMANLGGAEAPVDFEFTLRLRSALFVRQALVRLKQLEVNYDRMSEQDRAAFDSKFKGLLECPACGENYVLTLSSKSKQHPGADAVYTVFKGGRLADLQRYISIANGRGESRPLIHFVPPKVPGDEATFFFPRFNEKGDPLLTLADTELIVSLNNNEVNMITNFRIEVSKLVVNGQVDF